MEDQVALIRLAPTLHPLSQRLLAEVANFIRLQLQEAADATALQEKVRSALNQQLMPF